eukprot:1487761-Amphidinium_carterae.2
MLLFSSFIINFLCFDGGWRHSGQDRGKAQERSSSGRTSSRSAKTSGDTFHAMLRIKLHPKEESCGWLLEPRSTSGYLE